MTINDDYRWWPLMMHHWSTFQGAQKLFSQLDPIIILKLVFIDVMTKLVRPTSPTLWSKWNQFQGAQNSSPNRFSSHGLSVALQETKHHTSKVISSTFQSSSSSNRIRYIVLLSILVSCSVSRELLLQQHLTQGEKLWFWITHSLSFFLSLSEAIRSICFKLSYLPLCQQLQSRSQSPIFISSFIATFTRVGWAGQRGNVNDNSAFRDSEVRFAPPRRHWNHANARSWYIDTHTQHAASDRNKAYGVQSDLIQACKYKM